MKTHPSHAGHQSHGYIAACTQMIPEPDGLLLCMWSVKAFLPGYVPTGKRPSEETVQEIAANHAGAVPFWHFIYSSQNERERAEIIRVPSHGMEFGSIAAFYAWAHQALGGGQPRAITTMPYCT